jgi:hypothetical protein
VTDEYTPAVPVHRHLHRLADDGSGEPVSGHEAEIRIALARHEPACLQALPSRSWLGDVMLLAFRQALLGPSGAYWLDDRPDLRCQGPHPPAHLDGWRLSCMALHLALPGPR